MLSSPSFVSVALAAIAIFSSSTHGRVIESAGAKRQDAGYHWADTWTSMPQLVESSNMPPAQFVRCGAF